MMKLTPARLLAPLLAVLLLLGQTTAQAETASLTHDDFGNITQRTVNPGTAGQATITYGYDALNRLNTEAGPAKTQTLTYDADGNRMSDGSGNYTYDPNSNKMLTTRQGASVITDPSGRITSDGTGRTYTYNQAGQLYTISKNNVLMATYYYNSQSQRTRKVTTASAPQGAQTAVYHYDQQGHLLAETSGTGTAIRTYVWRDDTPIAQIEHQPTRKILYYEVDHLNTPRAAMDESGKTLWQWESDAFGSTAANEDVDNDGVKTTVNLRFSGQYYDAESGLNYNYFRSYDSSTGRYTTPDPVGLAAGINPLIYVASNPLKFVDPKGLAGILPGPVPLPLPGPSSPSQNKPNDDGSYGGVFPPGTMPTPTDPYGPNVKTEQRVPPLPPIQPPGQGGDQFCQKVLEKCMKGANLCPTGLKPVVVPACFAAYLICRAAARGGDHPSD